MKKIRVICGFSPEMDDDGHYELIWWFEGQSHQEDDKAFAVSRYELANLIAGLLMARVSSKDAFNTAHEAVDALSLGERANYYIDVDRLIKELEASE